MLLDSSTPGLSEPFPPEILKRLKALEKKRSLVENRMLLWLTVPVLWAIPIILAVNIESSALTIFSIVWVFIVLFGMGTYIHVVLPSNEEISKQYKKAVIPELMRIAGAEGDYSLVHGLKVDSFLKSGLFHEQYSHFDRTDSIIGKYKGVKFGLYELAVQVSTTLRMGLRIAPQTTLLTNIFYGWVLHVPIRAMAGNTYIIPSVRKSKHESDDWIKATKSYFENESDKGFKTNDKVFDATYSVYTNSIAEAEYLLQPAFRAFLLWAFSNSKNAPAFSFTGNRACMHLGISDSAFERSSRQRIYPPDTAELMEKIAFFCTTTAALHAAAAQKTGV
jgi:hypothetical protein